MDTFVTIPLPGPVRTPACQPITGIPDAVACLIVVACSVGSSPPRMIAAGFAVIAWVIASRLPCGVPCPS